MVSDNLQQKTDKYVEIHKQIRDVLKWKVSDNRVIMMIASLYAVNQKDFHAEHFLEIAETIKKRAGMFSALRSYQRFTMAGMLDVNFKQPIQQIDLLLDTYEQLVKKKFQRGAFTYIAASVLLTNGESTDYTDVINKAMALYQRMRKAHIFLTNKEDYPLVTLLAQCDGPVDDLIARTELFYDRLHQSGFRKGNDLQFLSHILSLDNPENIDTLVNQATQMRDTFKLYKIKTKSMYYPLMGMLTLLPPEEIDIPAMLDIYDRLNKEKHFKWQKDMNFMMAVNFYVSGRLNNSTLSETSIYTTMEAIIQAQQAVMYATIASTTAAAATSNNNSN
jgi:hypothetical protein